MYKPEYMIINRKMLFVYLSYIASLMHACTLFHVYYCKLLSMHVDLNTFLNKKNISSLMHACTLFHIYTLKTY